MGKSRLVTTVLEGLDAVYYLADERDERLQRQSLAREIERLVPGFARVEYPDWDALFDYRARAPHAVDMHPTDEHLLPWYVAAGAGGRDHVPRRLHESVSFGSLGMDAYAFGAAADALVEALSHDAAAQAAVPR